MSLRFLILPLLLVALAGLAVACVPVSTGVKRKSPKPKAGYPLPERGQLCLFWCNAENLFHPSDAPSPFDDDFTPEGELHWSFLRYRKKLTALAKLIVAAGRGRVPDIVGLCEIEEGRVLEDLVAHPILQAFNYAYLHREGPDHRGMEVACLVRAEALEALEWKHIGPAAEPGNDSTREMLNVHCMLEGGQKLEVVFLHFISPYRGRGASAGYRRKQTKALATLMDSLKLQDPACTVVAGGDFNAVPGDWSVELPSFIPEILPACGHSYRGTYKYRGQWSLIDYFLVLEKGSGLQFRGSVMAHPALLCTDQVYGGIKPLRTYDAYDYRGGVSDHLPVVLDISW